MAALETRFQPPDPPDPAYEYGYGRLTRVEMATAAHWDLFGPVPEDGGSPEYEELRAATVMSIGTTEERERTMKDWKAYAKERRQRTYKLTVTDQQPGRQQ